MFNRLDSNTSKEILENIEQVNPNLVETIRHLMFVFEDLLLLDVNAIKEVLAKVDRKILTIALKGTSEQMKNHMLQAMSQRGAEMLREDMDALGPIKIKEVEARAAADHRRGAATGNRRRDQPEGHGRRAVCRLEDLPGRRTAEALPIEWRAGGRRTAPVTGRASAEAAVAHAAGRRTRDRSGRRASRLVSRLSTGRGRGGGGRAATRAQAR